jgi:hypothetical protein
MFVPKSTTPSVVIMTRTLKAAVAALCLAVILAGAADAGDYEDGVAALLRGDYPTAMRLLKPLADQGDARAQAALAGIPGVSNVTIPALSPPASPLPLVVPLIVMTAIFGAMGIALGIHKRRFRARRVRIAAAQAAYLKSLTPEALAELEHARRIAQERPWQPIAFNLDGLEISHDGFRVHAAGVHRGRAFGFGIVFTMAYGPVAVCEWLREGEASEALLDILADYADVPRADSRFDELVKTGAIVLQAVPSKAPFAQLTQLQSKVFFELAEDNPEIYLSFDFAAKTGTITEKDPNYRKSLVHAFHV